MPESVSSLRASDLISSHFVSVQVGQSVSLALAALKKGGVAEALVLDGKKLAGLMADSGLLRNVDITKTKVSTVMRTTPSISLTDSFEKMVRLMRDADVRVLAVIEKGSVSGVVTAQVLLSRLQNHETFSTLSAQDLASFHPTTIQDTAALSKALRQMKDSHMRKLPVLDAQKKPVGVLRLEDVATDVLLNLDRKGKESFKLRGNRQSISPSPGLGITVRSVMDENIPVVSSSEKGKKIIQLLSREPNAVVLVSKNGLPGLISTQNVLDCFLNGKTNSSPETLSTVFITHLPDVDEIDKVFIEEILNRTYGKMERIMKGEHIMHAVYKQSNKAGLRAKTEVHLTISGAGRTFNASSSDWKVRLATKEACSALESEVEKRFRSGKRR
jgi:predicted transcriptional regulator